MENRKGKLILDGNALYEIDAQCVAKKKKTSSAPHTGEPVKENPFKEERR